MPLFLIFSLFLCNAAIPILYPFLKQNLKLHVRFALILVQVDTKEQHYYGKITSLLTALAIGFIWQVLSWL